MDRAPPPPAPGEGAPPAAEEAPRAPEGAAGAARPASRTAQAEGAPDAGEGDAPLLPGDAPGAVYLTGTVVREEYRGPPVEGAIVEAGRDLGLLARREEATTRTSATGEFVLGPLAPASSPIEIDARGDEGRAEVERRTIRRPGRYDLGLIRLRPGAAVVGAVLSPAGRPAPWAVVSAVPAAGGPAAGETSAGPAGRFWLRLPPGEWVLRALDGATGDAGSAPVRVERAGSLVEADVMLAPSEAGSTRTRIIVRGPAGEPVAGAAVLLYGYPGFIAWGGPALDGAAVRAVASVAPGAEGLGPAALLLLPRSCPLDALRGPPRALVTGGNGAVEARLGRGPVWIVALGPVGAGAPFGSGGAAHAVLGEAPAEVIVPVRPLGALEGTFTAAPGVEPPPRATMRQAGERPMSSEAAVAAGRFGFDAIPAGTYVVGAEERQGYSVTGTGVPGYVPVTVEVREGERARIEVAPGGREDLLVRLAQAGEERDRLGVETLLRIDGPIWIVGIDTIDASAAAAEVRVRLLPGTYAVSPRGVTRRGTGITLTRTVRVPEEREVTFEVPAAGALVLRCPRGLHERRGVELTCPGREVRIFVPAVEAGEDASATLEGIPEGRYALRLPGFAFDPPEVEIVAGRESEARASPAPEAGAPR